MFRNIFKRKNSSKVIKFNINNLSFNCEQKSINPMTTEEIENTYDYKQIHRVKDLQFLYNGWFNLSSSEIKKVNESVIEMFRTKSNNFHIRLHNGVEISKYFEKISDGMITLTKLDTLVYGNYNIVLKVNYDILTKHEHRFVLNKLLNKKFK